MTKIIGAGMAGLLAAAMLREDCEEVLEAQDSIPNNHSAVLRFRSRAVSDVLNIPFKEVSVMKAIAPWRNPVADAMAYSRKTNGSFTLRSITTTSNLSTRYIAPPDFIQQLAVIVGDKLKLGKKVNLLDRAWLGDKVISTIPMPALMNALGWETDTEFRSTSGKNIVAQIHGLSAYASLYTPDPEFAGSRISFTGNEMIIECPDPDDHFHASSILHQALDLVGITRECVVNYTHHDQTYSKILPIDDNERKRFILWATEEHGIYSLGRFATWRPGLLLDDVVNDVRVIHALINGGTSYHHKKKGI